MNCPKCQSSMELIDFQGITVDRCTSCKGIWFDGAEHRNLKKTKGAESIDIGTVKQGQTQNDKEAHCPQCATKLETISDTYQQHIHYDVCPQGHGVFFDAGEFRDFVKEDFGDFFKSLLSSRKKK